MEAATTLRAQMSLIYQILNDLRDLRAAADFRDEIAVNGGLDVQATKIVNFQRAECSESEPDAGSHGGINVFVREANVPVVEIEVAEPGTIALLLTGLATLGLRRRSRTTA